MAIQRVGGSGAEAGDGDGDAELHERVGQPVDRDLDATELAAGLGERGVEHEDARRGVVARERAVGTGCAARSVGRRSAQERDAALEREAAADTRCARRDRARGDAPGRRAARRPQSPSAVGFGRSVSSAIRPSSQGSLVATPRLETIALPSAMPAIVVLRRALMPSSYGWRSTSHATRCALTSCGGELARDGDARVEIGAARDDRVAEQRAVPADQQHGAIGALVEDALDRRGEERDVEAAEGAEVSDDRAPARLEQLLADGARRAIGSTESGTFDDTGTHVTSRRPSTCPAPSRARRECHSGMVTKTLRAPRVASHAISAVHHAGDVAARRLVEPHRHRDLVHEEVEPAVAQREEQQRERDVHHPPPVAGGDVLHEQARVRAGARAAQHRARAARRSRSATAARAPRRRRRRAARRARADTTRPRRRPPRRARAASW